MGRELGQTTTLLISGLLAGLASRRRKTGTHADGQRDNHPSCRPSCQTAARLSIQCHGGRAVCHREAFRKEFYLLHSLSANLNLAVRA